MAEFRINISKLSEGIHKYNFEAPVKNIGFDSSFENPVVVNVELDKGLRQIKLNAKVIVVCNLTCDRCLENYKQLLVNSFSIVYIQDNKIDHVDSESDKEVQVINADQNYIDLDEDVRQYVVLNIPPKLLCKDDCQGLCPMCGINKNIAVCKCETKITDPRWDALKQLSCN